MRAPSFLLILVAAAAGCGGGEELGALSRATTQCPTDTVEGVDVYAGDGTINWAQVKSSGRLFAFIKATQGDYNKQSTFVANWTGSKAAGLLRSPYHFFDATVDGVTQAQWFLAEIAQAGGIGPGDLPPMLDIECPTSSSQASASSTCLGSGSGWAPSATIAQRAFDWLATVEAATGARPLIYSYPSWFASVGFTDAKLATYPLFIATYAQCANVPAPWTKTIFWQYSATTKVPGIGGGSASVDVDRFMGTAAELQAYVASAITPDGGTDGMKALDGMRALDGMTAPDGGASQDLAVRDLAPSPGEEGGGIRPRSADCSCQLGRRPGQAPAGWLLLLLGLVALPRRR